VADFAPIPFVLARATAVSDAVGGANHVFLVPDEGREQLRALHDRLHAGSLRSLLRPELVFVPHVTVAACGSDEECERVATKLNETRRTIRGSVPGLDLIEVAPSTVRTLSSFPLGLGATGCPSGGSGR
jgi:2'-5' RNA ligase